MDYLIITVFTVGLFLFVLSWLLVIFAGFRHHFVTGLVSAVPVINLLILPSIWHKVYKWILVGFIGLMAAIACWYLGADKLVYRYSQEAGIQLPGGAPIPVTGKASPQRQAPSPEENRPIPDRSTRSENKRPSGDELPKQAIYSMRFKAIDLSEASQYSGSYIRITRKDRKRFEGKLLSASDRGLRIERRIDQYIEQQDISIRDIENLEVINSQ